MVNIDKNENSFDDLGICYQGLMTLNEVRQILFDRSSLKSY